jgi:hypothetical protein
MLLQFGNKRRNSMPRCFVGRTADHALTLAAHHLRSNPNAVHRNVRPPQHLANGQWRVLVD